MCLTTAPYNNEASHYTASLAKSPIFLSDKNKSSMKNEERKSDQPELKANQEQEQHLTDPRDIAQLDTVHPGGSKNAVSDVSPETKVLADMNIEAPITPDDVMRAGGFGARDDIGCFLPVASDSTDLEASLREARDYEDPQEGIGKPGLGWKDVGK